jgi:hypothetical protein
MELLNKNDFLQYIEGEKCLRVHLLIKEVCISLVSRYTKSPFNNAVPKLPERPVVLLHFKYERLIREGVLELFNEVDHSRVVVVVGGIHGSLEICTQLHIHFRSI